MDNKIQKLENPARLAELSPKNTLINAGLTKAMTLCDIGAGTGIFTFPAAELCHKVYALEISDDMLALLNQKTKQNNLTNLATVKVTNSTLPLESGTVDMAVMVTVLHEIEDKALMLTEIHRILKYHGRLLIIEFHKRATPMGPPETRSLAQNEVITICKDAQFNMVNEFSMGENFYGVLVER